jgi:hypothetical protein
MASRSVCASLLALAALALGAALPPASVAQTRQSLPAGVPETEQEKQEREVRRECAIAVCSTLHQRRPDSGQVTCNLRKTWRKEVLTAVMARGKLPWPWGKAHCVGELTLDRATLIKAMTEPQFDAQFGKHDIRCELENEQDKFDVKFEIKPKVTFKQGKAVKASLNWGKIEAPRLAKTALWSATAADNSFGVLQSTVVEDINEFIQGKCMEVKEEWQGK